MDALGQAERNYLSLPKRQTDYEIAEVAKRNPTEMTLAPVPTTLGYDPIPAFNWSFDQLENIARGEPVDEKVDENLLNRFAKTVPKEGHTGATGLWITYGDKRVDLNIEFRQRAESLASLLRIAEKRPEWMIGKSLGTVTGELLQVDDFDGRHQFAIQPPVGSDRIICNFKEHQREELRSYVFRVVRVNGILTYEANSPFPSTVEMTSIEEVVPVQRADHLLQMYGLFSERENIIEPGEAIDGL